MSNLWFTAGVGVGISGACGLPLVWRARKPLPCALRSSANPALGHERRASVPEHHHLVLGLCLSLPRMQLSLLFSVSLFSLLVRVSLKLRSLRYHPPGLCRIAVFSIQTNIPSSQMLSNDYTNPRSVSPRFSRGLSIETIVLSPSFSPSSLPALLDTTAMNLSHTHAFSFAHHVYFHDTFDQERAGRKRHYNVAERNAVS